MRGDGYLSTQELRVCGRSADAPACLGTFDSLRLDYLRCRELVDDRRSGNSLGHGQDGPQARGSLLVAVLASAL